MFARRKMFTRHKSRGGWCTYIYFKVRDEARIKAIAQFYATCFPTTPYPNLYFQAFDALISTLSPEHQEIWKACLTAAEEEVHSSPNYIINKLHEVLHG